MVIDPTILAMVAQQAMKLLNPEAPPPPGGADAPGIDMQPAFQTQTQGLPGGSKINAELLKADGQPPPPSIAIPSVEAGTGPLPQGAPVITAGSTGSFGNISGTGQAPTDDLDVVQIPTDAPPSVTGEGEGMSLEAKMAIAAQLGSLARGPAPPSPPHVGAGPGINMQPVFLKDLPRG
jgi:hypothetical protein